MLVCPLCRIVLAKGETSCPRDGQSPLRRELFPLPAAVAGRFQVIEPFADGDAGTLYLADDKQTGRRGILKLLRGATEWTVAERSRLKRELVKQATLTHGGLAVPFATGEADNVVWVFREWVDGISLAVRLARSGALAVPEALGIAAQLAAALDELHRAGLLQRDLSPGHVIVHAQPSGVPKVVLIDSGVAMRVPSSAGYEITGKPGYVSPEHAQGKLVSFRSDLYSLGCVIYEMLAGTAPFRGSTEEILEAHRSRPAPTLQVAVPTGVAALLSQLLAKEPRDRPFSAQQVRRTLEPYLPEDASRRRDRTMEFAVPLEVRAATAGPSRGTGTLRPPHPKRTILGLAVPRPPGAPNVPGTEAAPSAAGIAPAAKAPRDDPTWELSGSDLAAAEPLGPPPPPFRRDAEATMPLSRQDQAPGSPPSATPPPPPGARPTSSAPGPGKSGASVPPPPPRRSEAPPRPPGASGAAASGGSTKLGILAPPVASAAPPVASAAPPVASAAPPAAVPPVAPPPAAAPPVKTPATPTPATPTPAAVRGDDLDYDDLADTTALEREHAVAILRDDPSRVSQAALTKAAQVLAAASRPAVADDVRLPESLPPPAMPVTAAVEPPSVIVNPGPAQEAPVVPSGGGRRSHVAWLILGATVALCGTATVAGAVGGWLWARVALRDNPPPVATTTPTTAVPEAPNLPPAVPPTSTPTTEPSPERAREPSLASSTAPSPPPAVPPTSTPMPEPSRPWAREPSSAPSPERARESSPARTPAPAAPVAPQPSAGASAGGGSSANNRGAASATRTIDQLREDARAAFAAQRYEEAARAYEQATRLRPREPNLWAGLGAARLQAGDPRGAIDAYRQALSIDPHNPRYHVSMGRALAASGDRARARQAFEHALRLDPNNREAREQLSRL
jgi:serine/threonine-protein kinase